MSQAGNTTADPSQSSPALPFPIKWFNESFGGILIGTWLMITLYGIASAQTFSYFAEYSKDSRWLKGLVYILWILNTAHAAFSCHLCYHYLISSAFDVLAHVQNIWSLNASVATHIFITMFFYVYFVRLTYQLSGPKLGWIIAPILATFALVHICFGLIAVVNLTRSKLLSDFNTFSAPVLVPMAVTQVAADILLSTVLCVLLKKHKTAFKRTNSTISTLMVFAISRGILTSISALVEMPGIAVTPDYLWYGATEFTIAGLYTNSLLATLNARNIIREAKYSSEQTSFSVPLSRIAPESHRSAISSHTVHTSSMGTTVKTTEDYRFTSGEVIDIDLGGKHSLEPTTV